jgi:hypothetical protein
VRTFAQRPRHLRASIGSEVASARETIAGLSMADRLLLAAGSIAVVGSFAIRIWTIGQPLIEAHSFRQTQTAYTALIYHREGIDLLQTPLPVLGPPWVVPFEFPLFEGISALVMDVGVPTEVALRSTSLFFFVVSAALLWGIVRLEADARTAFLAITAFALAPLGLLWSRSSMVETIAVAAALACILETLRWDRGGSRIHLVVAMMLGALAALLKITTAAIWLAPAIFLLRRSRPASITLVAASAAVGLAWTGYTDAIKAANPATAWLTSAALRDWNFGTVIQRLDPAVWRTVFTRWVPGLGVVVLIAPFVAWRSRIGLWAMATLVLGPLVFTNLYFVHDYYWMAVAPAAAILIGQVGDRALKVRLPIRRGVSVVILAGFFALSFVAYSRWHLMFNPGKGVDILVKAAQIQKATSPSDLVAIDQHDWNPNLLFYADRRGYMDDARVPPAPPGYVHFDCTAATACVRR